MRSAVAGLTRQGYFRFATLEECGRLARYLAGFFPEPDTAFYGLNELMTNAVEHGNLGIGYAEKARLVEAGTWKEEMARRAALPENAGKAALAELDADVEAVRVLIADAGPGFDWSAYWDIAPARVRDPNGRGIATARRLSFTEVRYLGSGNRVLCTVRR